jgi:hypothetical protein
LNDVDFTQARSTYAVKSQTQLKEHHTMRFIVMHKVGPRYETGAIEQREIVEMGAFIQEAIKQGTLTNGAGLLPRVPRTRVIVRGGQCEVQENARCSDNLLAGFALLKVKNRAEAIAWTRRFAEFVRDGEMEIGLVTEAWDLGFATKPANAPERYLTLMMANADSESGAPPAPGDIEKMGAFISEMVKAGVLEAVEGIQPSTLGTRLRFKAGKRTLTLDGPFTESKELIAGFALISVPSKEAALAWAERYGAILTDLEVDVLALHDVSAYDGKQP